MYYYIVYLLGSADSEGWMDGRKRNAETPEKACVAAFGEENIPLQGDFFVVGVSDDSRYVNRGVFVRIRSTTTAQRRLGGCRYEIPHGIA